MTTILVSYTIPRGDAASMPVAVVRLKDAMLKDWKPTTWHLDSAYMGKNDWQASFHIDAGNWQSSPEQEEP